MSLNPLQTTSLELKLCPRANYATALSNASTQGSLPALTAPNAPERCGIAEPSLFALSCQVQGNASRVEPRLEQKAIPATHEADPNLAAGE